jgi:hypothetical protein
VVFFFRVSPNAVLSIEMTGVKDSSSFYDVQLEWERRGR